MQTEPRRFPDIFGFSAGEIALLKEISIGIGARFKAKAPWKGPMYDDRANREQAALCLGLLLMGIYAQRNTDYVEGHASSVWTGRALGPNDRDRLETDPTLHLHPIASDLIKRLSLPITRELISKSHKGYYLEDDFVYLSHIAMEIAESNTIFDKYYKSDILENIAKYIVYLIEKYISELTSDKSRNRKRSELPRPDLPANHHLNLKIVGMGVRSAPELKEAVDKATERDSNYRSRNDWVNRAIQEKLERDHPDLVPDPYDLEK